MLNDQVTVVVALYNGADHCVEALASVFAQTRLPDEVVVVDDGSDDRSAAMLGALEAPVPVRFERQSNQGQSAARNTGLRLAAGGLVAFLDQDDVWTPDHLERLCAVLEADHRVGWAYSDFDEIDAGGRDVTRNYRLRHGVRADLASVGDLLGADLMVLPSASVVRRDAVLAVGGFDPELTGYEDDDLFVRMFRAGHRSAFVPMALTRYRVHDNGSSSSASFGRSRVRFLAKMRTVVPDQVRSNRYWVADVLYPRLYEATLLEYAGMLRAGDRRQAVALAAVATELADVVGPVGRRRRLFLRLLRHPRWLRLVVGSWRMVPVRWRPRAGSGVQAILGVRVLPT